MAAVLAAMLALGGCWGIPPIERTGLVSLLAVDQAPGGYAVTAAIISPPGGTPPGFGGTSQGSPVLIRQDTSPTVSGAIRLMDRQTYLDLETSHLQVIVVSEALARSGLAAPLATLATSREMATTAWLLVVRGQSAASVLHSLQEALPQPGDVLFETVTDARNRSPYRATHVFTYLDRIQLAGDAPTTAGVSIVRAPGSGTSQAARLTGIAMFRGDRLVGWLDGDAALGWAVGTGRTLRPLVTLSARSKSFSFEIVGVRRRLRVTHTPAGPRVEIDLRINARLTSAPQGTHANFWQRPGQIAALQEMSAAALTRDVQTALREAQAAGADVFSLGEYVRVQDPSDWAKLRSSWDENGFRRLPVTVHVQVGLAALGDVICPLMGPC